MKIFSGKAPGKVILFGEHAVVYGYPAIAAPVIQANASAVITTLPGGRAGDILLEAPDIGLHGEVVQLDPANPLRVLLANLGKFFNDPVLPEIKLQIHSEIPISAGMGSGAAISVAVIRAYAGLVGRPVSPEEVSSLAFEIEKIYHGTPSGIDNTVITYAKTIFYQQGHPITTIPVTSPFNIIIADTGIKKETALVVARVRRQFESDPVTCRKIFSSIGDIADKARRCIENGSLNQIGALMNYNQQLLRELGVSCPEIDNLVQAALESGAAGAKLSGAGQGGNIIVYPGDQDEDYIKDQLTMAGAVRTISTTIQNPQDGGL